MTKPAWARVLEVPFPSSSKLVLLALLNHCDRKHECYPSIELLAQETMLSPRTVRYHLRLLEELGVVATTQRFARRGQKTTNYYKVLIDNINCSTTLQLLQEGAATTAGLSKSPIEVAQLNTPSEYFVLTAERCALAEENTMRHEIDEGPDQTNPFGQEPEQKSSAKKKPAPVKPVEEWNFSDLAKDFGFQAQRYFPTRANRVNIPGLAGGLKKHAADTGADVHLQLALIDAFFDDMHRGMIGPDAPLWKQFLARLDALTKRAEFIKTQTRELRQGHSKHEPKPVYATEEDRVAAYRELHGETDIIWED